MAAFSISFGLEINDNPDRKLMKNGGEELWVGCRGGYIHKFEGSKVVNVNDLNVTSMKLQPHHELDGIEVKYQNDNSRKISPTCHKRIEWNGCKLLVVGYSEGTLKIFDVNAISKDTGVGLCTYSIRLCQNAITCINDIRIEEAKNEKSIVEENYELVVKDDGCFSWVLENLDESEVEDEDETPDNIQNRENYIEIAILLSTEKTLDEHLRDEDNCHFEEDENTLSPKQTSFQSFALFLSGLKTENKYVHVSETKGEEKGNGKNDAAMQMMKIAPGHEQTSYLSMGSIIVWSRLKKVVRYIDIPPMLIGATKEEIKSPISKALFFMTKSNRLEQGVSKEISWPTNCFARDKKREKKPGTFEPKFLHNLNVGIILDNGEIKMCPTIRNRDDQTIMDDTWITVFVNEITKIKKSISSISNTKILSTQDDDTSINCNKCSNGTILNAAAFVSYPMTWNNCFLVLYNPACCLSLKFWKCNDSNRQKENDSFSVTNYFVVDNFISESYWPYETDLEKQMPISICMTIVHLFKKRYLVVIFSPSKDDDETKMKMTRRKSSIFVTEIPMPMGDNNLSSWDDDSDACLISKFKVKNARKLYLNGNEDILDPIIDVNGCSPNFEEFFVCIHESHNISIWTVKGSQLKQIVIEPSVQLASTISDFMVFSNYLPHKERRAKYSQCQQDGNGNQLAQFTISLIRKLEDGNRFRFDIINVFSGDKNLVSHVHGHCGSVRSMFSIPVRKIVNHQLDPTSSNSSKITAIGIGNAIKRKWNTERSQFISDKKRRIGLGFSKKNEKSVVKEAEEIQQNRFYSNVMKIPNNENEECKTEPDEMYRIPSYVLSTSSFEDCKAKLWASCCANKVADNASSNQLTGLEQSKINNLPSAFVSCQYDVHNSKCQHNFSSKVVSIIPIKCLENREEMPIFLPNEAPKAFSTNDNMTGHGMKNVEDSHSSSTSYPRLENTCDLKLDKRRNFSSSRNVHISKQMNYEAKLNFQDDNQHQNKEKGLMDDLVFILNEDGRMVVTQFFSENSTDHQQREQTKNKDELLNCDHNHWEFAKHRRNKEDKQGEEKRSQTRKRSRNVASKQYCLECCCSSYTNNTTTMNNKEEEMSLLMLVRKECRENKNDKGTFEENGQDLGEGNDIGYFTYLEKAPHGTTDKKNMDVDDYTKQDLPFKETGSSYEDRSFLNKLLFEKEKQKRMLQTLGEKGGIGKMTSLNGVHISSFNDSSSFYSVNETDKKDKQASVQEVKQKYDNDTNENGANCHFNFGGKILATKHNLTSLEKEENEPNKVPKRRENNEKLKKTRGRKRRTRPESKNVSSFNENVEKTESTPSNDVDKNVRFGHDYEDDKCDDNNTIINDTFVPNMERPRSNFDVSNKQHIMSQDDMENKSKSDTSSNEEGFSCADVTGSSRRGHDHNYSFVIFITTSFQRMYPYSPLFIIWSYDIMMDDQDTEEVQRERQKSCYNNSFTFGKEGGGTQNLGYNVSPIMQPIGVIPCHRHQLTGIMDKLSSQGHEQQTPLALCSDIKIIQKGKKHQRTNTQHLLLEEITVIVLLGLETGNLVEYFFDMVLIPGSTHASWVMSSSPKISRKFNFSSPQRIVSVQFKQPKFLLEERGLSDKDRSLIPHAYKYLYEVIRGRYLYDLYDNECFMGFTMFEEQNFARSLEVGSLNNRNVEEIIHRILTHDNICLSQSLRSYKLSTNCYDERVILYGSKDGIIHIYEVSPKIQASKHQKYKVKKVGQYSCGSNFTTKIVSCALIESKNNSSNNEEAQLVPAKFDQQSIGINKHSNSLENMKLIGHVVAANESGDLFLLKILTHI